jgi:hypothetical protein
VTKECRKSADFHAANMSTTPRGGGAANGLALTVPEEEVEIKHHRDHDGAVEVDDDDDEPDPPPDAALRFRFSWKKLWRFAGPGWLMSLAYLDPGNLESSLQQGAYTGFSLVWVLWWATVMGLVLQEMSARLGLATGRDLAQTVRAEYPRWLNYVIYVMMEIAVIGADIQEVVGSGVALNLMTGMPVWLGCLITGIDTFTFLAVQVTNDSADDDDERARLGGRPPLLRRRPGVHQSLSAPFLPHLTPFFFFSRSLKRRST